MLVGDDPGSPVYVAGKQRACREVGMEAFDRRLPATASAEQVADELHALNADDAVSGVLLQLPLPDGLDGPELTALISPEKDVDGLTPVNVGLLSIGRPGLRPCTPLGVMELLSEAGRPRWRAPKPSSSGARTCSASRWPSCCWRRTRPSPPVTRARATCGPCARARRS